MVEGGEFDPQTMRMFEAAETLTHLLWSADPAVDPEKMSVKQFKKLVEKEIGFAIAFNKLKVQTDTILGTLERTGETSIAVYVAPNLPPFDQRWVEVKELCQAYLGEKADFTMDARDTLSRLDASFQLGTLEDKTEHRPYFSELLAYGLAGELLYPFEKRRTDIARVASGNVSVDDISEGLNVPRMLVDRLLNPAAHAWWQEGYEILANRRAAK